MTPSIVEVYAPAGEDFLALLRHEDPAQAHRTTLADEVYARAGEDFLALLRHEDPAHAHRTTLADEVSQVAAGTEFKMSLPFQELEAHRRSTSAVEEHLGTIAAIEEQ